MNTFISNPPNPPQPATDAEIYLNAIELVAEMIDAIGLDMCARLRAEMEE